ncbi:unnamed protein product [Discosporangium mesarthrocarpum]
MGRGGKRKDDKSDSSLLAEQLEQLEERRAEQISRVAFKLVREIQRILKAARETQSQGLGRSPSRSGGNASMAMTPRSQQSHHQPQGRTRWAGTEQLLALLNGDVADAGEDEKKGHFSSLSEAQAKMSDLVEEALVPEVYGDLCGTLLEASAESRPYFVKLCVDAGLPSNLVHCLRIMRVIEFERGGTVAEGGAGGLVAGGSSLGGGEGGLPASSNRATHSATERIGQLLVALCKDKSSGVGEQIKPHLPGLLSLAVSAYPPNGAHVQEAAGVVVEALMGGCLNSSMVWLLHYNKVMLDIVGELRHLCGLGEIGALATTLGGKLHPSSSRPSSPAGMAQGLF